MLAYNGRCNTLMQWQQLNKMRMTPAWSYPKYVKVKDSLAQLFLKCALHEDALQQYDELDAVFSSMAENARADGGKLEPIQRSRRTNIGHGMSLAPLAQPETGYKIMSKHLARHTRVLE